MFSETISLDEYRQLIGRTVGVSRWFTMDQTRIDRFAQVTEDEQFLHVDPEAAAKTPFGGTIAHGFLSVSMLSAMAASAIPQLSGTEMAINYGLNSVRFLKPVGAGKRIRGVFVLKDMEERALAQWQFSFSVTVEVERDDRPALVAEWLMRMILPRPES